MFPVLEIAHSPLTPLWFILISVLWIGFFFLEGFDFGVAMLLPFMGKDDRDRRVMVNTIGPVWDGNEVWLITAGGAMFAAFPGWYATMFSGLYLPLLLVLFGLILRGVSFEYRSKHPSSQWRTTFDAMATIGSFLPTLVLGVGFANFVRGIALGPSPTLNGDAPLVTTSFWGLFTPFALVGGILFVVLFCAHGAGFVALKTTGHMHQRAGRTASTLGWAAAVVMAAWALMFNLMYAPAGSLQHTLTWVIGILAVLLVVVGALLSGRGRDGLAFVLNGAAITAMMAAMFIKMWGNIGFRPVGVDFDMWIASSTPYTLKIMTISTSIFLPLVLAYQIWSYWVFRKRISKEAIPSDIAPASA
ncbi:cytochrome d ubiquinol oxidase subunit II [Acidipropionibacterium virtanenii]|uniref:Cytochrome bd-I ubiquinol oxidase subunit 2 n=1 Tax=Acidipropionibacterium virtanenii TaxID=2057246 RepID=A0A344UXC2_9ACTN|nr:cytochrome d ubiquinol oxidase subunit II [Acidipropionibacterium virtanenii]AXE39920.1 Cytochrome bd-I ubiquinol oxidase subunit 2 [Acidipropionibacterium virtanenii]